MSMLNFDCPECGHNLEVDSRGAGFIVKCPECHKPIQIPELPHEQTAKAVWRKAICIGTGLLLFLFALYAISELRKGNTRLEKDIEQQEERIASLKMEVLEHQAENEKLRRENVVIPSLEARLKEAHGEWEGVFAALDGLFARLTDATAKINELEAKLLKASREETMVAVRADLAAQALAKRKDIPAPVITDVEPGKGIQGKSILFGEIQNPAGKTLLKDAEVLSYEDGLVTFKSEGRIVGYRVPELHPGVAGWLSTYLPIDPLLGVPEQNWPREAQRILAARVQTRKADLDELRKMILGEEAELAP